MSKVVQEYADYQWLDVADLPTSTYLLCINDIMVRFVR